MNKLIFASAVNLLIILMALPCVSYAQVEERKGIVYTADFETGAIQGRSKPTIDATVGVEKSDAGYLKGMAAPLDGTCTPISTTSGGAAIASQEFTRVVTGTSVPVPPVKIHCACRYIITVITMW